MSTRSIVDRTADVMSKEVVYVAPQDTIHEALELMVENRVSALPVVDNRQHCIGVISMSDLADVTRDLDNQLASLDDCDGLSRTWACEQIGEGLNTERVDSVMTERVATVTPETLLATTAREMLRHRVHHLPVVNKDNVLVGIVSTMDMLEALANNLDVHAHQYLTNDF